LPRVDFRQIEFLARLDDELLAIVHNRFSYA
jgi:hypothetical protein